PLAEPLFSAQVRYKRAGTLGLHDIVPHSQTGTTPAVDSTMIFGIVACLALGLSAILYRVYKSCKNKATFFKALGVPGPTPHPIYGNLLEILEMGSLEATEKWVSKYGDITGFFDGFRPVMIIRDPELLRQIFIRNFDNFSARQQYVELSSGIPVNEEKLSRLYGGRWRELRTLISPAFNSSKLKRAFPMMNECTDEFLEILDKTVGDRKGVDISIRFCRLSTEILLRFTMGTGLGFQAASEQSERLLHGVRAAIRRPAFNWILYSNAIPLWLWIKKLFFYVQGCLIVRNTSIFHRHIAGLVRLRKEKKRTGNDDLLQLLLNAEEQSDAETKPNRT
ncbi:unnamed protein product, partial [Ixodes persulcatus]